MKLDRDYIDDLGGAYHFAPRDIYNGELTRTERIFIGIIRLILWAAIIYFVIL